MNERSAIRVERASKKYSTRLRQALLYGAYDMLRDVMGIGADQSRLRPGEFWVVDDLSFQVERGECLGIIGPNGAGKSTILKLLSGLILPDLGRIEVRGRVGSLIELGAGFHPQLTARENIFINGAMLGMSKREIKEKYEAIVEFADLGEFMEMPIKFYSSGMYVRLGFAIAAHMNQDALLIDEVLSVGDRSFREKCMDRIRRIKKSGDCAIVFISHNLWQVQAICDRAVLLNRGRIVKKGTTAEVIEHYEAEGDKKAAALMHSGVMLTDSAEIDNVGEITEVRLLQSGGAPAEAFGSGDRMGVEIAYRLHREVDAISFSLHIIRNDGLICSTVRSADHGCFVASPPGEGRCRAWFDPICLHSGAYSIVAMLNDHPVTMAYSFSHRANFIVTNPYPNVSERAGIFFPPQEWSIL